MTFCEMMDITEEWFQLFELMPCRACFKLVNEKEISRDGLCGECSCSE